MKSKAKKRWLIVLGTGVGVLLGVVIAALSFLRIRTAGIVNDCSSIYTNEKYEAAVYIENIAVVKQEVSCGYAVLEMFSQWTGQSITEEGLYSEYGKVVTSTGQAFCNEMNKQFPEYHTVMYQYLKNTELIDKLYDSLSKGHPVPIEWAALCENEWTLHYSLVIGMDIPNDTVVIANPYGYYEEISVNDFLKRTSFEAYSDMPFYLELAFAFGVFEKNTIFIAE